MQYTTCGTTAVAAPQRNGGLEAATVLPSVHEIVLVKISVLHAVEKRRGLNFAPHVPVM